MLDESGHDFVELFANGCFASDDAHAMFDDSGHDVVELFACGCFASTPRIKNFELEDPG